MELTPKGQMVVNKGKKALLGLVIVGLATCGIVRFRKNIAPDRPTAGTVAANAFGPTGDAAVAGATPGTDNLGRALRVGINIWPGYAPGLVENGNSLAASPTSAFARNHGLQVQFILLDDFAGSRTAFRSGEVDVLWGTVDSFAQEAPGMMGLHPKAFMQFDFSRGGDAIAAIGSIRTVNDLRGKRVAYAPGTPSQYLLVYALTQANLSLSDITSVNTATAIDAANAFRAGNVDAAVSWDPDVVTAANSRPGGHILLSTETADHLIADIFVARSEFIAAHRETLARFAAGWFEGVRTIAANPTVGAQALASCLPGVNITDAPAMLHNAALSTYGDNRAFFGLAGTEVVTFSSIFRSATNVWRGVGLISQVAQAEQVVDTSVLASIAPAEQAVEPTTPAAPRVYVVSDAGTPVAATLTRRLSLQFPVNSATIDGNAEFAIRAISELASSFGGARMRVTGNTDNTGNAAANMVLSRQRAQAIVDWLVSHDHYDPTKFEVVGAGSSNPVCTEATPDCRARNRRTDFEVIPVAPSGI